MFILIFVSDSWFIRWKMGGETQLHGRAIAQAVFVLFIVGGAVLSP
jgi:hypothetical protein